MRDTAIAYSFAENLRAARLSLADLAAAAQGYSTEVMCRSTETFKLVAESRALLRKVEKLEELTWTTMFRVDEAGTDTAKL